MDKHGQTWYLILLREACLAYCDSFTADAGVVKSYLVQIRTQVLSNWGHGVLTFALLQVSTIHSEYTRNLLVWFLP